MNTKSARGAAPLAVPPAAEPSIVAIQVLRAAAALVVLAAHIDLEFRSRLDLPNVLPDMGWGAAGVDLFFVISGFVMVHASRGLFGQPGAPRLFVARRLARVVPLYWAVTALYVVLSRIVPDARTQYGGDLIVASLLFWPHPNVFPVVGLGWTLNYEMFFYVVFALALPFTRDVAVGLVASALIGLVAAGNLWTFPLPISYWAQSIVLEFVFGMLLAPLFRTGRRLPVPLALALIALGGAALLQPGLFSNGLSRGLGWGLPAAAIFAGFVLGDWRAPRRAAVVALAVLLGDASYALYLTHAFVIRFFRGIAGPDVLNAAQHPYLYVAALTATACGAAILVHLAFEKPLTTALTARLGRRAGQASGRIEG